MNEEMNPHSKPVMRMVICPLNGWHPLSACNICEHHLGIHTNVDTLESEVSCGYIAVLETNCVIGKSFMTRADWHEHEKRIGTLEAFRDHATSDIARLKNIVQLGDFGKRIEKLERLMDNHYHMAGSIKSHSVTVVKE